MLPLERGHWFLHRQFAKYPTVMSALYITPSTHWILRPNYMPEADIHFTDVHQFARNGMVQFFSVINFLRYVLTGVGQNGGKMGGRWSQHPYNITKSIRNLRSHLNTKNWTKSAQTSTVSLCFKIDRVPIIYYVTVIRNQNADAIVLARALMKGIRPPDNIQNGIRPEGECPS